MSQNSRSQNDTSDFGPDERRRFLDLIGREIRTPLNGVVAVAELLARQPLSPDAQAYVRTIVDSSQALLGRLEDAMDLVAGEAGGMEIAPEAVQLRAAVDEVQAHWQARRSAAGAALLISYDGEPDLAALTDGRRLKQLFDSLIGDALRVTPRGAVEANLRARVEGDGIRLEGRVRDAGPSLTDNELARLFEPDSPRKGSGLSLPLCRQIARALGGVISAERNAGSGVSVTFSLLAPAVAEDEDNVVKASSGPTAHVLVVDDNATNRMVAESLCEMFDCTSESAEDGVEAVEAARTGRFDLILMDIKMPRMDGVEATRQIRALDGAAGRVPIIALTANADPDDARAYIACGMSSVVEKPIKPDRLLQAMNTAFSEGESSGGSAVRAA
jgi:two-component system, sensor histidine kinase